MKYNRIKNQGVALITVLLIVALAAILATQMTGRLQMQMQRTANIDFNQQAYWYAISAESFTKRVLFQTFKDEPKVTHLDQPWAQGETSFPVDNGQITGEITDLQSCFNLNALANKNAGSGNTPGAGTPSPSGTSPNPTPPPSSGSGAGSASFSIKPADVLQRLIIALDIEGISSFEAESMTDALTDWLDDDSSLSNIGGAEDNDYSAKEFPYLAANNLLASVNELRVVEHFTVPAINALKDYVCVLPNKDLNKININTIDSEKALLLGAMLDKSKNDAEQILSARPEKGFETVADFFAIPEMSTVATNKNAQGLFTVVSEYFALKATTSFNNSFFTLNSVIQVSDSGKEVNVISRSVGRY